MHYFDRGRKTAITPNRSWHREALPPAFPAIIDIIFLDGGILTPPTAGDLTNSVALVIDFCSASLRESDKARSPRSSLEALDRAKDIRYSSRIASSHRREQEGRFIALRHVISQLVQHIPAEQRNNEQCAELAEHGCKTHMHVVRHWRRDREGNHTRYRISVDPRIGVRRGRRG